MPDSEGGPGATYADLCNRFARQRDDYARRWNLVANLRLILFVAAVAAGGLGWWLGQPPFYAVAALFGGGFVAAALYHAQLGRRRHRYAELWAINAEGTQRLRRDWATLPLRRPPAPPPSDPAAADLDLLGHASLQHLLNTVHTPIGQTTLQDWLLHPAAPSEARARQAAVTELAPLIDLRDELALAGRRVGAHQSDYERFLSWAESDGWFAQRRGLVWLSRLLPLLALGSMVAQASGLLAVPLWGLFILANIGMTAAFGWRAAAVIEQVSARQESLRAYATLFRMVSAQQFIAPALRRRQAALTAGGQRAEQQMQRLGLIMAFADLRFNMFFAVIQLLTLWNLHILWLLERWQATAGSQARAWLKALGEVEALAALATLQHDNPAWVFAEFTEGETPQFTARGLGHPLLPPAVRVANDVAVGPPGTFLLVTGSNMSGKSTLLRSIGMNAALAQAGGPVCATALRLPPLLLGTSMRIQDSLEQGVSYFMAELQRLKLVVDAARQTQAAGDYTLLFLLDEILHGTNTGERQVAARQIIRHLLRTGAIGAVSTHDLTLADAPDLAAASRPVHFAETFTRGPEGPMMRFDYRLRPGLATSTNALKLMELVGLALEEEA